jgi:hypothetical protein
MVVWLLSNCGGGLMVVIVVVLWFLQFLIGAGVQVAVFA